LTMVVWNIGLPESLTNAECERGDVTKQGGVPPVRIVAPVKDPESTKKKSSVTFYVGPDNTIKETHEKFDSDEPEEGILHFRFFKDLLKKKGLIAQLEEQEQERDDNLAQLEVMEEHDLNARRIRESVRTATAELVRLTDECLDLFEQLLGNHMVQDWIQCRTTALEKPGYLNSDDEWVDNQALGKVGWPSVLAAVHKWLRLKVPKNCAELQRRYISTQVKFPENAKGVKIKPFLIRIKKSNDMIVYMPCLKDTKDAPAEMPRANVPFPGYELCMYMLNMLPRGMQAMYWSRKGEHHPHDVDKLIEDLHTMEPEYLTQKKLTGEIRAIRQASTGSSSSKSSDKKNGKRKMGPGDSIPKKDVKRTAKLCQHCAQWAPQIKDTHNTKDCRKWNPDGTPKSKGRSSSGSGNYKNSNAHTLDEMKECFATMQKQNERLMKYVKKSKKSRRGRRGYASSDSDSDSD